MTNKHIEDAVTAIMQEAPLTKEGFAPFVAEKIRAAVEKSIEDDRAHRSVEGLTKPTVRLPDHQAVESFCVQANSLSPPGFGTWSDSYFSFHDGAWNAYRTVPRGMLGT